MVTLYFFGQKEIRIPTIYMPVHEEVNFALGADGGDGGAAEALDDVAGEEADAAGGGVDEDGRGFLGLAWVHPAELDQAVPVVK